MKGRSTGLPYESYSDSSIRHFYNLYMGRCPAKSPFWSFYFITIKIVRYAKQHIFTTVLYFLFKFRTLVHTSVLSGKTDFGALDIFHAMVTKVSNPMG